jgi:hypothetical protein
MNVQNYLKFKRSIQNYKNMGILVGCRELIFVGGRTFTLCCSLALHWFACMGGSNGFGGVFLSFKFGSCVII